LGSYLDDANRFLHALETRGLSSHTLRAYGYDLVIFYRWMAAKRLELKQLNETKLLDWIAEHRTRRASSKTINRRLIAARLLYRFHFDREVPSAPGSMRPSRHYVGRHYDPKLGILRVRRRERLVLRVKVDRKLIEPLSQDQVQALLRSVSRYRDLIIVLLMLFCGLRSAEVRGLKVVDTNLTERSVKVRGKGNKERMVPLPETLVVLIEKYQRLERPAGCRTPELLLVLQGNRRGEPMSAAGIRSLFRSRRRAPDLRNANAHRLRHTFGASMARSGVKLPVLQRLMGHSDPLITLQYIQLSMADVVDEYHAAIQNIEARYHQNLRG
jgi:site-specific recombinase XerD